MILRPCRTCSRAFAVRSRIFPTADAEKPFSGKRVFTGAASRFRKMSGKTVSPGNYPMPEPICIDWNEGSQPRELRAPCQEREIDNRTGLRAGERQKNTGRKNERKGESEGERERKKRKKNGERNVRRIMRFRFHGSG